MANIPDPKAKDIVNKITNDKPSSRFYKNFVKFLVDFNVIGYTSAFLIALSITNILNKVTDKIQKRFIISFDREGILISVINLIILTIMIYLFIENIFYKYMYTQEVSIERKFEKVIDEKQKEDIEKSTNLEKIERKVKQIDIQNNYIEPFESVNNLFGKFG
jgi:ATP/ADP translocase